MSEIARRTDGDQPVRITSSGGVLTIAIDRPRTRNAIDTATMRAISQHLRALADDVRVVVLTGVGDVFSAGADLGWMAAAADASEADNVEDSRTFEAMLRAVYDTPVPVVARVNGHAIAGASGLVACADLAVAVRSARFGFTEVRLGLVPAMVSSYVVPRIGLGNARRYLLTGELFDAEVARHIGLVHEVCEPDELDVVVDGLIETLLAASGPAQRVTKSLLPTIAASDAPAETETLRVQTIAAARASSDAQQRIRTFLEERGRRG